MNETQQKIYTQAKGKWDAIAKPIDSLGVFEDMVARLCAIAGTVNPGDYKRRALLTLCADHGVVAEGVTQTDASVTKVVAENIAHGCSGVNYMAQMAGVDVYAVDIGMRGEAYPDATFGMGHMINRKVQAGTGNLAKEPAMSMEICDRAIEAGKELVGKNGVVREKSTHYKVIQDVINYAQTLDLYPEKLTFSPIKGPAGNIEYLVKLVNHKTDFESDLINKIVEEANENNF